MHTTAAADPHERERTRQWTIWSAAALIGMTLATVIGIGTNTALTQSVCVPHLVGDSNSFVAILSHLAFSVLGILIIVYRPANRIGWLCLAAGMLGGSQYAIGTLVRCALDGLIALPALPYLVWFEYHLGAGGILWVLAVLILLPMTFPTGRFLSAAWRHFTIAGFLMLGCLFLAAALLPDFRQSNIIGVAYPLASPLGIAGLPAWWHSAFVPSQTILLIVLSLAGIAAIIIRLRRSSGIERQQMKWLTYFFGFVIGIQLLVFEFPGMVYPQIFETIWYQLVITAMLLGYPFTIGLAIFKYRLYNIDIIIRRTLVYGALTITLGATYLLSIVTLQAFFVELTGQTSTLAVVASTLAIAALFNPLRHRIQAFIDRRFFRKKYDAQQVLAQFAQRAQQEADLDTISADILGTVQETLEPEGVQMWVRRS